MPTIKNRHGARLGMAGWIVFLLFLCQPAALAAQEREKSLVVLAMGPEITELMRRI
ncbi:MAG: hypothetical protein HQL95_11150, partial [Magnetococcales bacterium]|nr:hypothetical protein [Magnetococcales bacterium]